MNKFDDVHSVNDLRIAGAEVRDANFSIVGQVHDWRNHVPGALEAIWSALSDETRGAIYLMADELAVGEEWD